jgi:hypothetical protein
MRADKALGRGARHVTGIGLQALLLAAIIGTVALAMSAIYKPAGFVAGVDQVDAAKPQRGTISVALPVQHGDTTTATVNPGGTDVYVRIRCWQDGTLVYGKFVDVDAANQAVLGPLASVHWTSGGATCEAEEGYFTRNGLGRWVVSASTSFHVDP